LKEQRRDDGERREQNWRAARGEWHRDDGDCCPDEASNPSGRGCDVRTDESNKACRERRIEPPHIGIPNGVAEQHPDGGAGIPECVDRQPGPPERFGGCELVILRYRHGRGLVDNELGARDSLPPGGGKAVAQTHGVHRVPRRKQ